MRRSWSRWRHSSCAAASSGHPADAVGDQSSPLEVIRNPMGSAVRVLLVFGWLCCSVVIRAQRTTY